MKCPFENPNDLKTNSNYGEIESKYTRIIIYRTFDAMM